jgi:hypothetical protein
MKRNDCKYSLPYRVQELDTALQSPSAQARMRQWKELPRDQLALILGTLYEKTSMVEKYVHLPTLIYTDIAYQG